MSFMVVNTGRAASRAFYLNLKAQPNLLTCSRYEFDRIVTQFINSNRQQALSGLASDIRDSRSLSGGERPWGVVFHGARPRLVYPFNVERNRIFLEAVRDRLGITVVFFPVRDPEDVLLSELNRFLARQVGDWSFPQDAVYWRRPFRAPDLAGAPIDYPVGKSDSRWFSAFEFETTIRKIALRTGKVMSMLQLFESVFPRVIIIPYEDFLSRPADVFSAMGKEAGFEFQNEKLVFTKLNSLSNRLLVYNPIEFGFGDLNTERCKKNWRNLLGNRRRAGDSIKFRFEIEKVITLCDDWGLHESLGFDCSEYLPNVAGDIASGIGLGYRSADFAGLSSSQQSMIMDPRFQEDLVGKIGPLFDNNYVFTKNFYRQLYLKEIPENGRRIFREMNGREHELISDALNGKIHDVLSLD